MRQVILCFSIAALLFSCSKKNAVQEGRVQEFSKMKEVMWDLYQAEAYTDRFIKTDSTKNSAAENAALQQKIFELHKITKADYDTSYSFYSSYPELMGLVLDSISANAEKKRGIMTRDAYSRPTPEH